MKSDYFKVCNGYRPHNQSCVVSIASPHDHVRARAAKAAQSCLSTTKRKISDNRTEDRVSVSLFRYLKVMCKGVANPLLVYVSHLCWLP